MKINKANLIAFVSSQLENKKQHQLSAIQSAQNAANQESKSSAGDKYETGRAMAQNDIGMHQVQLAAVQRDLDYFKNLNFFQNFEMIKAGALVETSIGYIFISVSLGKLVFENHNIMAISKDAPLGLALLSKKTGERIQFNHLQIQILGIF
jgi:hypothetical protein